MKSFLLPAAPSDRARTFYGKAVVVEEENGGCLLLSYGVPVCRITSGGEFIRIWPGYSATTMRHVNSFIYFYGVPGGGKKWWDALEVREVL